jgi:transposase
MVNRIKMATESAILALRARGWSFRRIARELGVHRDTVSRCVNLAAQGQNRPNPTPPPSGPKSACEPFREVITAGLEAGLTAQRIYQDLTTEHGFTAGYQSVKRFCGKLRSKSELPCRRIEVDPGAEAQVDFGRGGMVKLADGRRRRPHVLRVVLGFSRRGYSESIWRETTDGFLGTLEDSFHHFGGVPRVVVIDNLKAAVTKADWFDPDLNPKIEAFARHYGCAILPTKPRTPRHKGKVERGIGYVKGNALSERTFGSLAEMNDFLVEWEKTVADVRVHGTTKRKPIEIFEELERAALLPLPPDRFPSFRESERTVHRDGHVEVEKAYYSVPPEYVRRKVWVRWDSHLVRVLNDRLEEIAVHVRRDPGRFSTDPGHIPSKKVSLVERGAEHLLKRAALIGPDAQRWAETVVKSRGPQGMRVVMGLLSLARKLTCSQIDRACGLAVGHGAYRLKNVKALVVSDEEQEQMFTSEHPVIRSMKDYGRFVRVAMDTHSAKVVEIAAPRGRPSSGEAGPEGLNQ